MSLSFGLIFFIIFISKSYTAAIQEERISKLKCDEYSNAVYKRNSSDSSSIEEVKVCGKLRHKRVAGGVNAEPLEFPHMALLGYDNLENPQWQCGGSLISLQHVLTAAHCLKKNLLVVRIGELDIKSENSNREDIPVKEMIIHPNYSRKLAIKNNIGIIKLSRNVEINEYKYPACISTSLDWPSSHAIATGWGHTHVAQSEGTTHLMKVVLDIFSESECQNIYKDISVKKIDISYENVICAGSKTEEKDTCRGDSGGPLQIHTPNIDCNMYTIIGISSFGVTECGTVGIPSVFTNVAAYIDWIEEIVWK